MGYARRAVGPDLFPCQVRVIFQQLGFAGTFGNPGDDEFECDSRRSNHRLAHHDREVKGDAFRGYGNPLGSSSSPRSAAAIALFLAARWL